ncbi:hypothetical protein BAUCODRAFT_228565 [Baudoinia panamericana UAMH 10762]|uniref:Uncharacterized protein n=1 Tax=Baudoinia panamericana (strain UAMH 10762) TaxID=717646 RepID=M2LJ86_BAUPA|nr:uncharacterized protein BAUCODRAFT_228565 [Baudoinia panamericana UAMH 10762]EMC94297.1 hypothetical protein BAUCODRAFT_228565 [Baudoinia panamericana UAMH 10762]
MHHCAPSITQTHVRIVRNPSIVLQTHFRLEKPSEFRGRSSFVSAGFFSSSLSRPARYATQALKAIVRSRRLVAAPHFSRSMSDSIKVPITVNVETWCKIRIPATGSIIKQARRHRLPRGTVSILPLRKRVSLRLAPVPSTRAGETTGRGTP